MILWERTCSEFTIDGMDAIRRESLYNAALGVRGVSPQSRNETYQLIINYRGHERFWMDDLLLTCDYQPGFENTARVRWPWRKSVSEAS